MASKRGSDLTLGQRLFAHEYAIDGNGTRAARDAGYKGDDASLASQASQLLNKIKIQELLNHIIEKRIQKLEISGEKVLNRLDNIGDFDPAEAYTELGALKNIHDIPVHLRKCIASIEVMEVEEYNRDSGEKEKIGEITKIKFWDKIKANELVGRHLKLFNEVKEHKHSLTLEQLVGGSNADPKDVTPLVQTPQLGGAKDDTDGSL